ncbi:MAG TPA: hypothetical protein VJO13_12990 [Ktedonobacterales bacterium]|nr:hypothetical protein [Ktedonobacterales bacterium]
MGKRIAERVMRVARHRRLRLFVEAALLIVVLPTALVVIGLRGATALHVTVTREVRAWDASTPYPPDHLLIYDKTFDDVGLVRQVQDELNGLPYSINGGGLMGQYDYQYVFSFSTLGVVTQVFSGADADVIGRRTLYHVPVSLSASGPGPLLRTLNGEIGIPLQGQYGP